MQYNYDYSWKDDKEISQDNTYEYLLLNTEYEKYNYSEYLLRRYFGTI